MDNLEKTGHSGNIPEVTLNMLVERRTQLTLSEVEGSARPNRTGERNPGRRVRGSTAYRSVNSSSV